MSQKLFVDCHCHLFNIVDIPLYATLEGKIEMGTLKRLVYSFAAAAAILTGKAEDELKEREEFLRFFERSIKANTKWLANQIKEAVPNRKIVITPLVMDFDMIHGDPDSFLDEPKLGDQMGRLLEAIEETKSKCLYVRFYPFLGYDLRKLTLADYGLADIKRLWRKYGTTKAQRENASLLKTGSVIGIKLYPPIGFNPYPSDEGVREKYLEFYRWCKNNDIPVTVHCQSSSGSYSVCKKSAEVNRMTNARNWWRLLNENQDINQLRINFAHFGGEEEMKDLFDNKELDKSCWTYYLIKLLKTFDNTYADISAYDYTDEDACEELVELLKMDKNGEFDNEQGHVYKLADKLLWGSDVPMVISQDSFRESGKKDGASKYKHLYKRFKGTVPGVEKMINTNPKKFLKL